MKLTNARMDEERAVRALVHKCVVAIANDVSDRERVVLDERIKYFLSGLATDFARVIALDTTAFAAHVARKRVTTDDVLLMARRDASLTALLTTHVQAIEAKKKPRRSSTGVGAAAARDAAAAEDDG